MLYHQVMTGSSWTSAEANQLACHCQYQLHNTLHITAAGADSHKWNQSSTISLSRVSLVGHLIKVFCSQITYISLISKSHSQPYFSSENWKTISIFFTLLLINIGFQTLLIQYPKLLIDFLDKLEFFWREIILFSASITICQRSMFGFLDRPEPGPSIIPEALNNPTSNLEM